MVHKCACNKRLLIHIPITDLVNIIHDYAAVTQRTNQNEIEIRDGHGSFRISFGTGYYLNGVFGDHMMIFICYNDSTLGWRYDCNGALWSCGPYEDRHICAEVFRDSGWILRCIQYDGIWKASDTLMVRKKYKARLRACIKNLWRIFYAEETGGHLHPDPRIIWPDTL